MKKTSSKLFLPLKYAIFFTIAGILVGTVFTFGMQYWNKQVSRDECVAVETRFVGYEEIWGRVISNPLRKSLKTIEIDCENGERYTIDGVSITSELKTSISNLTENEPITLLIHPNSDTIVEFTTPTQTILEYTETINRLGGEAIVFLCLGILMYLSAVVGVLNIVRYCILKKKSVSA